MLRARYVRTVLAWHDRTQDDLATILGITRQAANRKLKGARAFKDDELLAIADAFAVDPGMLLRPPALDQVLGSEPMAELTPTSRERWKNQLVLVSGTAASQTARFSQAVRVGIRTVCDRHRLPERFVNTTIVGLRPGTVAL